MVQKIVESDQRTNVMKLGNKIHTPFGCSRDITIGDGVNIEGLSTM